MGRVTIVCLLISSAVMLIAFGKGMSILHGGDVSGHLTWALIALLTVVGANCMAMIHAAQADRLIRELRRHILASDKPEPPPH